MDKRFEYLDHTADIIIKAYGKDFSEALSNSILALSNICIDINFDKSLDLIDKEISLISSSKESLFYDLLNEIIFIIDTEFISPVEITGVNLNFINDKYHFYAKLKCIKVKDSKIKGSVKSATYNNMKIIDETNNYIIQTVVDL